MQYFLDDFGNFENLVKIWTRRPPNYYQNASTNTKKCGDILEHIIFVNLGTNKFVFWFFWRSYVPFVWVPYLELYFLKIGFENVSGCINKMYKSLDMNFISIKKHETIFLVFSGKGIPKLFIFKEGPLFFLFSRKGIIKY